MPAIDRRTLYIFGGYAVAFVLVALANLLGLPPLVRFVVAVIGARGRRRRRRRSHRAAVAARSRPAATGVVQSVLGNLPELFLAIFALQAGLARGRRGGARRLGPRQRAVRARAWRRSSAGCGTAS